MWQRGLLILFDWGFFGGGWKVLEGWIHRDCLVLGSSDVFHYDLRGDSLQVEVCGNAGCFICLIGDFLEGFGRFWKGGYIGIA